MPEYCSSQPNCSDTHTQPDIAVALIGFAELCICYININWNSVRTALHTGEHALRIYINLRGSRILGKKQNGAGMHDGKNVCLFKAKE